MNDIPRTLAYRFLETIPGITSWLVIIAPIAASVRFPRAVAVFITFYVVLWFLRSAKLSVFLILAHFKNKKYEQENWLNLLRQKCEKWENIRHVVIIATYKEEKEILETTIDSICESDFPLSRIIVVLATEERDRERAELNTAYLKEKFAHRFGGFYSFMHPANIPGEVIGKGPNISHAGQRIAEILKTRRMNFSDILVTTLDADNRPHPKYFSNLTYHYLTTENRKECSYQPLPFFYNNIWEVPVLNRIISLTTSFWQLKQSVDADFLRNFAAHAQSLDALTETDFWSRHTIDEDGQQFWRSYFAFNGRHKVVPLFIPIYQDAVQNRTYFTTLRSQYIQIRRWAWGVTDIPYVILKMWKERKHLPFWKSLAALWVLFEGHIMWATAPIVLTFTNPVPAMINKEFAQTLFAYNLGMAFSWMFKIALASIVISIWISLLTLPRHPRGKKWLLFTIPQWILLPIVTIAFGAIPALDAQTRLILNKPLGFTVTEKIRRKTG